MDRRIDRDNFKSSGCLLPFLMIGLLVIGLMGGVFVYHHYELSQLDRYPFRGVSVTQQDGDVDFFSLAKVGQKFVYIRASQGSIYTDNNFSNNYQRAEGSGLKLGVYHVFSFNSHPQTQFKNFQDQVTTNVGSLPIAIQVNSDQMLSKHQIKALRIFINYVERYYHRSVIIWTSQIVAKQLKLGHEWIDKSFSHQPYLSVLKSKENLTLNGQDNDVTQLVFNDNQRSWHDFSSDVNQNRLN